MRVWLPALLLLLAPVPLMAGPNDLGVEIHRIDIDAFPRVQVGLSLLDPTGRALKGLERRNFRAFESGVRAEIEEVVVDRTPVVAVICVDSSGSMTSAIESVKRAAGLFIRQLDGEDQAEVIAFADDPRILSARTRDKSILLARLQRLVAYGATALYDAMWRGLMDLQGLPGRRVLLVLTDGQDQNRDGTALLSRRSLAQVLEKARADAVPIYTIGLGGRVLKDELTRIASQTGGRAFFAPKPRDLQRIYLQIASNLKSQVILTYRSPVAIRNGLWRTVEVRAGIDERQGTGRELYRAPGKYVLEVAGQGYDRLKASELPAQLPNLQLHDVDLNNLLEGLPSDLTEWLLEYYQRPEGEP